MWEKLLQTFFLADRWSEVRSIRNNLDHAGKADNIMDHAGSADSILEHACNADSIAPALLGIFV